MELINIMETVTFIMNIAGLFIKQVEGNHNESSNTFNIAYSLFSMFYQLENKNKEPQKYKKYVSDDTYIERVKNIYKIE